VGIEPHIGGLVKRVLATVIVVPAALFVFCSAASAQTGAMPTSGGVTFAAQGPGQQPNVPPAAQRAEDTVERVVRRFGIGVDGGVALDPELIQFGAHGTFAPIFRRDIEFRPGIEFGVGELTTMFGINLDVVYFLPGSTRTTRWMPYVGAGPNFALSHRGLEIDVEDGEGNIDTGNRFDFGDTDFATGFNFIAGARNQRGVFFELRATAHGVSNVKLMAGYNF
jgi:hypothetical protein